ncbi:ankyrin repeat domain-containing protein [Legionella drancourtii]|uniref:Uncharacterized protein n=1 Tax=Legionella drancourtii LLAP12 TaxID=658187 RepID=G9EMF0_9GAMM|nr:ankyrin repeat domain-containing protein [Legionella drancourtii]EHL31486.1 hypothetical protein LDG_6416 [Legionella drancourtii LLAP12]
MIVPDKQFDSSACASKYSKEEGGYLSRFSSESTYETVFKRNLCEDDISSFLECTSIEETELQRVSDEEATLLYKIVELNDDTTNSKQIKILLDNATFNYDSTKDGMTPITFNGNINYQEEENGYTALTLAAHKKKYRLVELLLNLGADPLIQNYNLELASDLVPFDSPLFTMLKGYELIYATFIGDLKKVTSILNEGADINFQGLGGYTALLIAIEQDFADLTELLLSSGADLTITCADGQGAFELVNSEGVYNILLNTIEIPEEEEEYPPEEDIEIPETKEKQISPPNKIIEIPEAKEKQISPPNKIIEIPEAKEKQISPPNKIIEIPEAKEKQVLPSKKNKKLVSENVVIENEENRAATPIQENPNSFFSSVNSVFSTVSTMFKGLKFY